MNFCPNCGAGLEPGQRFCHNCGERLAQPAASELPKEPVYTEDPALLADPLLNRPTQLRPPAREEKVPELTLEPELWSHAAGAAAAAAAAPERPAAQAAQEPVFASVAQEAHYDNPLRDERAEPSELPHDYSMAGPESAAAVPDETAMLVWSIVLTMLCSICGVVGLVKTLRARRQPWGALKVKLLRSARVWLIAGTVIHAVFYLLNLA